MFISDDPVRDAERYMNSLDNQLSKLPRCYLCDEPIQQEDAVFMDGVWYCDECLQWLRKNIDVLDT